MQLDFLTRSTPLVKKTCKRSCMIPMIVTGFEIEIPIIKILYDSWKDTCTSVLAKERKSGAPPLLGIRFSFDMVERM